MIQMIVNEKGVLTHMGDEVIGFTVNKTLGEDRILVLVKPEWI